MDIWAPVSNLSKTRPARPWGHKELVQVMSEPPASPSLRGIGKVDPHDLLASDIRSGTIQGGLPRG